MKYATITGLNTVQSNHHRRAYHTAESLGIKSIERPAFERGTFPRYLVTADNKTTAAKTPRALEKILGVIYAERPKVFVNAGKSISINFDQ
jgi:hypothetical protein